MSSSKKIQQVMSPSSLEDLRQLLVEGRGQRWIMDIKKLAEAQGLWHYLSGIADANMRQILEEERELHRNKDDPSIIDPYQSGVTASVKIREFNKNQEAIGLITAAIPDSMIERFDLDERKASKVWENVKKNIRLKNATQLRTLENRLNQVGISQDQTLLNFLEDKLKLQLEIKAAGGYCTDNIVINAVEALLKKAGGYGSLLFATNACDHKMDTFRTLLESYETNLRGKQRNSAEAHLSEPARPRKNTARCSYCASVGRSPWSSKHDRSRCHINPESSQYKGDNFRKRVLDRINERKTKRRKVQQTDLPKNADEKDDKTPPEESFIMADPVVRFS